ncbi:MAG: hypothetical protein QW751_02660 [Candidatus Aenigmatarchaeota archaeon]
MEIIIDELNKTLRGYADNIDRLVKEINEKNRELGDYPALVEKIEKYETKIRELSEENMRLTTELLLKSEMESMKIEKGIIKTETLTETERLKRSNSS